MKHYLEYIVFFLVTRLLRLLPIDKSAGLCSFLARKIGPLISVTKTARSNLENVYGNDINIDQTIDDLWDNFGRYIGEFPFINALSDEELTRRISFTGLENIEDFKQNNQPFMLFLGHQANWDIVIRKVNAMYPKFGIVYRKANNPLVDKEIFSERNDGADVIMIAKGIAGAKSLVRAIKSKMSIAMLVDQKMNDGIEVPFFGKPAMTAPAIARLALQYNYPIVPCQLIRKGRSSNFELRLHKPLKIEKTGDMQKDCFNIMKTINLTLEQWIRQHPGQWFWFHNRWKG
ncbi:MAG: lipid A biosynthesis lauroyl acyltransferase [Rickettsiaceae bacterium]|nr:lipid A biosynthesis lauroyl acyltransferase [Rickettsiaceae bacterium]